MKSLLIAVLSMGIFGHAFAQTFAPMKFERSLSCYQIELGNNERMIISTRYLKDLQKIQNLDSVVRAFLVDYTVIKPTLTENTNAKSFDYQLLPDGQRRLTFIETSATMQRFQFHKDLPQPALIKYLQDTLLINFINSDLSNYNKSWVGRNNKELSVKFIVNNIDNLEKIGESKNLNQYLKYIIEKTKAYRRYDLMSEKYQFIYLGKSTKLDGNPLIDRFTRVSKRSSPSLVFHQTFGVGVFRNQLVPNSQTEVAFVRNKEDNVGYTLGWRSMFWTSQDAQTGRLRTNSNGVLQVGFTFYDFKKTNTIRVDTDHVLFGIYLGRVMSRSGDVFEKNTWNLSMTVAARGIVKIQPEVYFNGFFSRNVMPGLRVQVGF